MAKIIQISGKQIVYMDGEQLATLIKLINTGQVHLFYVGGEWQRLRTEVLKEQRYECQCCKDKGRHTKANHVHHVNHLRDKPELALSKWYVDSEGAVQRNLISVCKRCHESVCHPERLGVEKKEPITVERW